MIFGGHLTLVLIVFLGLFDYSTCFKCFRCMSMLSPNSTCDLSPIDLVAIECDTYCFTEVMMAAGVHVYTKRDCTRQFDCTEESTCRELAHSGNCKACCRDNFCNKYTGREVAYNTMESMGVSRYYSNTNCWAWLTTALSAAVYLSQLSLS
ncbi:uncharacterized protein LOC129274100 [Lytechinus pictus]|uniref:uncharacterized protein LOC129274100 n=1 Tax=Lytechinus pictus TaxID=7653 RepID=UPI0030B9C80C